MILEDKETDSTIVYKGKKNSQGALENIERIEVTNHNNGDTTVVNYLNETDRETIVNGKVKITQIYDSTKEEWLVKFVDGESGTSYQTNMLSPTTNTSNYTVKKTLLNDGSLIQSNLQLANSNQNIPVQIQTTRCGQAENMNYSVGFIINDGNTFLGSYTAKSTGDGNYVSNMPDLSAQSKQDLTSVKNLVNHALEVADYFCLADEIAPIATSVACINVSSLLASAGVSAPVGAAFFAACETAVVASKLSCKLLNKLSYSGLDPSTSNMGISVPELFLNLLPDTYNTITVTPYIESIPNNIYGESVPIIDSQPLTLKVDQKDLSIGDLILSPQNPAAGTSYQAKIQLSCIPFNTAASLQVSGSDGYSDYINKTWDVETLDDNLTLLVPGADQQVRDIVSFEATTRFGQKYSRQEFLVFN